MEKNGQAWVTATLCLSSLRLSLETKYANDPIDWLTAECGQLAVKHETGTIGDTRLGILTRSSDRDERDLVPNLLLWAHFEWQPADWRVSHNPPVAAIDLSLRTHIRHFNRLRITLWGTLLVAGPVPGGQWPCTRKEKVVWMWGSGFDTTQWEFISNTPIRNSGKLLPSCVYFSRMLEIFWLDSSSQ